MQNITNTIRITQVTGFYFHDLAGLLTRPYPSLPLTFPSLSHFYLGIKTVVKCRESIIGAHSSTVCPGFPPGSLFTQGITPRHQIQPQRYYKKLVYCLLSKKNSSAHHCGLEFQ